MKSGKWKEEAGAGKARGQNGADRDYCINWRASEERKGKKKNHQQRRDPYFSDEVARRGITVSTSSGRRLAGESISTDMMGCTKNSSLSERFSARSEEDGGRRRQSCLRAQSDEQEKLLGSTVLSGIWITYSHLVRGQGRSLGIGESSSREPFLCSIREIDLKSGVGRRENKSL